MPTLSDMFKKGFESEIDFEANINLYSIEPAIINANSYSITSQYITGSYYKATLTFEEFKKDVKESIKDYMTNNRHVVFDFLSSNFPEELCARLTPEELFGDIEFKCECLDYRKEDSCEHKNLTYIQILEEMKKDPYLIFKLRGFDIENWISTNLNAEDDEQNYHIMVENRNDIFCFSILKNGEYLHEVLKNVNITKLHEFIVKIEKYLPNARSLLRNPYGIFKHETLEDFIFDGKYEIEKMGIEDIEITLPEELIKIPKPELKIKVESDTSDITFDNLTDLDTPHLRFKWETIVENTDMTLEELNKLREKKNKLNKFKNGYVIIDKKEIDKIFSTVDKHKNPQLNKFELLREKLRGNIILDEDLEGLKEFFERILNPTKLEIPQLNEAKLKDFQKDGFRWCTTNLLNGFGVLLADDMGLGKTIQTIATILYLKENSKLNEPTLIIAPVSLLANWKSELERFAPSLKVFIYHGTDRNLPATINDDIILTTYATQRMDKEKFENITFSCIVLDEAQNIKNPDTGTTKCVKNLKAKYKIALTGTPVENKLQDLWSIFDFILPGYLEDFKSFETEYKEASSINKLKEITTPFMLRRDKNGKGIDIDLPEKTIKKISIDLTEEQKKLYNKYLYDLKTKHQNSKPKPGVGMQTYISLKKICNHPINYMDIEIEDSNSSQSGKTIHLIELLGEIIDNLNEKVLIFTQYIRMIEILKCIIEEELNLDVLVYRGEMNTEARQNTIDLFTENEDNKILIVSLKAGGTGLNLTSANHIIHYDLWYNPAVENQATDRIYRIGQEKDVFVYRFVTNNSCEEKIDDIITRKRKMFDDVFDISKEDSITKQLSDLKDIDSLVKFFQLAD